jgi:hypothetical protein
MVSIPDTFPVHQHIQMNYSSHLENFLLMIRLKVEGDKQASLSRFQQSAPSISADL